MNGFYYAVAIVIQGITVTEYGPLDSYSSCEQSLKMISNDIFTNYVPYDGTKWGLSNHVAKEDYDIQCVRHNIIVEK